MPRPPIPDPKRPDARAEIRDFRGFEPNADPHDIAPGVAVDQINATSVRPGELRVRLGCKVLRFDG